MAATGQWNGTKQRGWSSGSVPESAADMPCLVMACKGIVNSNQAPDFVISTSIKAGRCLGRGVCVSPSCLPALLLQLKALQVLC